MSENLYECALPRIVATGTELKNYQYQFNIRSIISVLFYCEK